MQSEVTQQPYVPEAREGHADGRLRIHPLGLAVIRHAALWFLAFAQSSNITALELANSAGRPVPSPCAARSWNLYPLEWRPTIYWSGILVGETGGTALTKDAHKMATKRQSLRWVLIDEVSMISAQLVGVLDNLIGKVAWKRDSWKR